MLNMLDQLACSVHGRKRGMQNLMEDGMGGYCCKPGNECGAKQPGDWTCNLCGDVQFARNNSCRKCGAGRGASAEALQGGCDGGGGSSVDATLKLMEQMQGCMMTMMGTMTQMMASGGRTDSNDMMQMMQMMQQMQSSSMQNMQAIQNGSVNNMGGAGCRGNMANSSAGTVPGVSARCSIHHRVRTMMYLLEDGAGGYKCAPGFECTGNPAGTQEGDWECPACGDMQFTRNYKCRKCSTPRPGLRSAPY